MSDVTQEQSNAATAGASQTDPSLAAIWTKLSLSLSFATGMVDIMAYLTLSKFFVTAITGTLILGVSDVVRKVTPSALVVWMVPTYLCGIILAYLIAHVLGLGGAPMIRTLLVTETAFFAGAFLVAALAPSAAHTGSLASVVIGLCAIFAVAVQNTAMRMADPSAPTTWAMTANTVHCTVSAMDSLFLRGAKRAAALKEVRATLPAIIGFVVGGLMGTFTTVAVGEWAWALPFATFAILLASVWHRTDEVEQHARVTP